MNGLWVRARVKARVRIRIKARVKVRATPGLGSGLGVRGYAVPTLCTFLPSCAKPNRLF